MWTHWRITAGEGSRPTRQQYNFNRTHISCSASLLHPACRGSWRALKLWFPPVSEPQSQTDLTQALWVLIQDKCERCQTENHSTRPKLSHTRAPKHMTTCLRFARTPLIFSTLSYCLKTDTAKICCNNVTITVFLFAFSDVKLQSIINNNNKSGIRFKEADKACLFRDELIKICPKHICDPGPQNQS